jgi:hypothetical protein
MTQLYLRSRKRRVAIDVFTSSLLFTITSIAAMLVYTKELLTQQGWIHDEAMTESKGGVSPADCVLFDAIFRITT